MKPNLTPEEAIAGLYVVAIIADGQLNEKEIQQAMTLFVNSSNLSQEMATRTFTEMTKSILESLHNEGDIVGTVKQLCTVIKGHYDQQTLKVICAQAMGIAAADGDIHQNEAGHIAIIMNEFGLSPADFR